MVSKGKRSTAKPRRQDPTAPRRDWRESPWLENPQHTTGEVLAWIIKGHKAVTVRDVAEAFGMSMQDATTRMGRLYRTRRIRRAKRTVIEQRGPQYEYQITAWGQKFALDQGLV